MTPCPGLFQKLAFTLNDPRDAVFLGLMAECLVVVACGISLFFAGPWLWYLAPGYCLLLVARFLDRFTLMLHCTSHRQLFKPEYRLGNFLIPWLIGPFFGQSPDTYFAHHMGMHHPEQNLADDLSSTMRFQRDRFSHWLRYYGRFLALGLPDLRRYMVAKKRPRLARRALTGEGAFWAMVLALALVRPGAALVVFVAPMLIIRTLMMIGNWGQHAFISAAQPDNPYLSSITCINTRYNRRCFNDGYHIGHHLFPRAHFTEYPVELQQNVAEYAKNDAIVFEGIDFFQLWLLLMLGQWERLAKAYVRLPGAPERSDAEVVQLLQERVRPIEGFVHVPS